MATPIIDVRPQHHIPLGKALGLCLKGISHRLLRSLLTFMVIVLAVAFFMSLLCESAFSRAVGIGVADEQRVQHLSQSCTSDWFDLVSGKTVAERLVQALGEPGRMDEIAAITGMPAARLAGLAAEARRQGRFDAFFEDLDAGSRAALVGKARGEAIEERLSEPQAWSDFAEQLQHLFVLHPPLPIAEMHAVVERHDGLAKDLDSVAQAWHAAIAALLAGTGTQGLGATRQECMDMLQGGDAKQLDAFTAELHAHGFSDDRATVETVHQQLAAAALQQAVREQLMGDAAASAWRKLFLENPTIELKMLALDRQGVSGLLAQPGWTPEVLAGISHSLQAERRRQAIASEVAGRIGEDPERSGQALLSPRQAFLMAISFVVCMVGITNAMLMAITERFREIATMKCLGATDGFILQQFLIEAAMQGAAGGVAGMVIGGLLSLAKCLLLYGTYLPAYFPFGGIALAGLVCIGTGILLSTLASIYPSWMASRMAPMEAMRIE